MPLSALISPWKASLAQLRASPENRLSSLDGVRAISILWVISFHTIFELMPYISDDLANEYLSSGWLWWMSQGDLSVDSFFVLSGFLIGRILMQDFDRNGTISFRRFYGRRALRLFPAYFLVMGFLLLTNGRNPQSVWANLIYVNNFLPIADQFMGWSWSLAIEEQFYTICPIMLLLLLPRARLVIPILVGLFIASFAIRYWIYAGVPGNVVHFHFIHGEHFTELFEIIYIKPYGRYGPLVLGVLAAYIARYRNIASFWTERRWSSRALLGLAMVTIFGSISFAYRSTTTTLSPLVIASYRNVFALGVWVVILYTLSPHGSGSIIGRILSHRIWYPIAQASYSMYLIHIILIRNIYSFVAHPESPGGILGYAILFCAQSFVIGSFIYILVERPFMNLRSPSLAHR